MPSLGRKIALVAAVGMSFLVITTTAFAKTEGDIKPGWGYGDPNHVHIGPPGQSVIPLEDNRIVQRNHSVNNISLNVSSITGGNNAGSSNGVVAIVTGAASTVVSLVNSLSQNIFGS